MAYKSVEIQLTDEQIAQIEAAIGDNPEPFALLAHPQVRGFRAGIMPVYIATKAQYEAIDIGVKAGRALTAFGE